MTSALDIVTAVFTHAGKGEWAALEPFMADDLVIHEPAALPYGGEWRGKDALQRLYEHVFAYWRDPVVTVERIVGDDDWAVAILIFEMTATATGTRIRQRVTEVTRCEGGKAVEMFIHYFDTAEVAKAVGAG